MLFVIFEVIKIRKIKNMNKSKLMNMGIFAILAGLLALPLFTTRAQTSGQGWPTTQTVLGLNTVLTGTTATSGTVPITYINPVTVGTASASGTTSLVSQAFTPNSLLGFAVFANYQLKTGGTGIVTFNFSPSMTGTTPFTTGTGVSVNGTAYSPYTLASGSGTPTTNTVYSFSGPNLSGTLPETDYYPALPLASGSGVSNAPYWYLTSISTTSTSAVQINSITISTSNR